MHRENLGEGKEAERLIYSLTIKGAQIEIKLAWKEHNRLYLPLQKHTNRVIELHRFPFPPLVGDAVITSLKGIEIGIRTADCVPLVLVGEENVGVVHAGWRGIYSGIVEKTIELLSKKEKVDELFAFIGPSAKGCCYEVGEEFKEMFPEEVTVRHGQLFMDTQQAVVKRLKSMGITKIKFLNRCTICDKSLPSYRRDRTQKRMLTSVRLG